MINPLLVLMVLVLSSLWSLIDLAIQTAS